jgi:class 3 adenylate cyclase
MIYLLSVYIYIIICRLPEPRCDHAVVMVRMACELVLEMASLTCDLEMILGPGTSELKMRAGINSGPTTAGILRGEKSRFQLFGDTINTAARMESNSKPGWVMCSQKTADLLIAAGKERWITARPDLVDAKGKG